MKTTLCFLLGAGVAGLLPSANALPPETSAARDAPQAVRITQRVRAAFPAQLLRRGVAQGEVRIWFDVSSSGSVLDQLVVGYTDEELAEAVTAAVPYWRFTPATIDGMPVPATIEVTARFSPEGLDLIPSDEQTPRLAAVRDYDFRARESNELDSPPKVLRQPTPANLVRTGEPALQGEATVAFFIDERGRVRMPVLVSADDERLGAAALASIEMWWFNPPLFHKRPALAHASHVFRFGPEK